MKSKPRKQRTTTKKAFNAWVNRLLAKVIQMQEIASKRAGK